jgi:hypothetical protein
MPQAQTSLQQESGFPEWLNFGYFREKGLTHIGQLSGNLWTDHNVHDPGITVLEVLCYALTDLGYRNQFDASALFARKPIEFNQPDDNFFSPAEILSVNPLSLNDFKRLMLEVPGVRNAWLVPAKNQELDINIDRPGAKLTFKPVSDPNHELKIKGLYDVYIDLEEATLQFDGVAKQNLAGESALSTVWESLQAHRTLCEDFKSIKVIESEKVWFCMDVDLTPGADPEDVFIEIFEAIQDFLTPSIKFYTLQEMLVDKQKNIDEVFEGRPLLKDANGVAQSNGFIDQAELPLLDPKKELHISDIYKIILTKLPSNGVRAIRSLKFFSEATPLGDEWIIKLDSLKSPRLSIEDCQVFYSKGQLPIAFDTSEARPKLSQRLANYHKIRRQPYELGCTIPQGKYYDFADYTSIQREFPKVYSINENQLPIIPARASEKEREEILLRRRQALQLKGYLAFFDQMLANYLAQLANVRKLFAIRPMETPRTTYFNAELTSMPDSELILGRTEIHKGKLATGYHLFHGRPLMTLAISPAQKKPAYSDFKGGFVSADLRDSAAYFFQKAFENDDVTLEIIDRQVNEDPNISPCDKYFFIFKLSGSKAVFRSNDFFESEDAALEVAELIRFLGILSQCYKDKDTVKWFKSQIIFNPLDYAAFLDYITETPERFYKRREKFLNHLLARFSEQFTEYTLLMYALEGKTKSQEEIIEDKSRFLSRYADISRNRAKAFDYTKSPVWDTDNVSGFEQRVAGFMGLDDWKRRTLNHLKLTCSQTQDLTEWLFLNTPIFRTYQNIADPNYLKNLFQQENIVQLDCHGDSLFGFQITDPKNGCEIFYLPSFTCAAERDEAIDFWTNYFSGKHVSALERNDRFCFVIKNADEDVFLKGKERFKKRKEAQKAFYQAIQLALDAENYSDLFDQDGYYFDLVNSNHDQVAVYPNRFETETERNTGKTQFIQFLQQSWLRYSVQETEMFFDWQLLSTSGNVLFINTLRHKKDDPSGVFETIWQSLKWARQSNGWRIVQTPDAQYYLSLVKTDAVARLFLPSENPQNWIEIGRSPLSYPTEQAAMVALDDMKLALGQPTYIERALILGKDQQYRFQLIFPGESDPIMKSLDLFATKAAAAICFEAFLEKATNPKNYQISSDGYLIVDIGNGKNAITVNPFPAINTDQYIAQLAERIEHEHLAMAALLEQKGEFYHKVQVPQKNGGGYHSIIGKKRYKSEGAAFGKLPKLLSLFQQHGLAAVASPGSEGWKLLLLDGELLYAEADQEYVKKPHWLLPTHLQVAACLIGDSYQYRIGFLDCACKIQYLLSRENEVFDSMQAAISAGEADLADLVDFCPAQVLSKSNQKPAKKATLKSTSVVPGQAAILVVADNQLSLISCADQQALASYTPSGPKASLELIKTGAFLFLTQPLIFGPTAQNTIPIQADYPPGDIQTYQPGCKVDRFRLRDESFAIAQYAATFDTAGKRETAAAAFLTYWKKANRFFPAISFATIVKENIKVPDNDCNPCKGEPTVKPYHYYFRFDCEKSCYTLIGADRFGDEESAQQQISDSALVSIMNLLADEDAYVVKDISENETRFELQVYDYQKIGLKPKLLVEHKYKTGLEARKARKAMMDCVKAYPFYLDEAGKICFRLYNRSTGQYDWLSTQCYVSLQEAKAAFSSFLRLLEYPANIQRTTKPFSLEVGEIMLESSTNYSPADTEYPGCPEPVRFETKVWESGVEEQLLARVFEEGGVVLADADTCGYTFRVVGSTYWLAKHPFKYRTAKERASQLKSIQALYTCGQTPRSVMIKATVTKATTETIVKNGDTTIIDHEGFAEFLLTPVDSDDIAVTWHMLLESTDKSTPDNAWNSLTPWAEYPEFYLKQPSEDGSFGLYLMDEDRKILAHALVNGLHKLTEAEADRSIRTTVLQAREHPLKRERPTRLGDPYTYVYRIYSRYWQPTSIQESFGIAGAYIWESHVQKPDDPDPEQYFSKCYIGWLNQASAKGFGYQNTREPDCGDFSFDAVDTSQVIAYYPAKFCTQDEAEAGIQRMLQLIDVEGFHTLENILLRPIRPEKSGTPLMPNDDILLNLPKDLTVLWSPAFRASKNFDAGTFNSCFDKYLPGSDPYSAQVTIVLPYWSKRFQNSRFRDFFENTLRRELPAHCRLRTVWATPQDMYHFEKAYRAWLTGMAAGEGESYKPALVAQLNEIKSYYKLILDDSKAFLNTATLS